MAFYFHPLVQAIKNTFNKRNTTFNLNNFKEIIELLEESNTLKKVFLDYQSKLEYTKKVKFEDTIISIKNIVSILEQELIEV